jgi:protein-L-isoaspartate(D-aspartate) O-methyltransferase
MDYADARRRMVDGQLRPNRVTDPRLLDAMRTLPREAFLPPALRSRAYLDEDVPLPGGRALLEPMVLARMLQLAAVRPDDRALVVCAGVGYGAAVLARMGARVVAVEDDAALRALAQAAFPVCGLAPGAVRLEGGAPAGGFPAASPYDAILVEGEVPEIPQALAAQLAEGGRLVAAQGGATGGRAVLGRLLGGAFTVTPAFDCAVPALPAFAPAPGFVF